MATPPAQEGPTRSYKLLTATYRDKTYSEGQLLIYEARAEIELTQRTGKRRRQQEVVTARFRLEPTAELQIDGPSLKISELSMTLESAEAAKEVAEFLNRPIIDAEKVKRLAEAEAAVGRFLETRSEAIHFLAMMKSDPRAALVASESMWPPGDPRDPFDAVLSSYSDKVVESLSRMTGSLTVAEKDLGPRTSNRLCALAVNIGAVQDALLMGTDLSPELASLRDLGVAATAEDLRMDKPAERLMARAHEGLVSTLSSRR